MCVLRPELLTIDSMAHNMNYTTKTRLFASIMTVIVVVITTTPRSASAGKNKPTVILNIMADDLGHADLSCGPSPHRCHETPNICSKIYEKGTYITNFFSDAPICSPSRAAIATGRYALQLGWASVVDDSAGRTTAKPAPSRGPSQNPINTPTYANRLAKNTKTYAKLLKAQGYQT